MVIIQGCKKNHWAWEALDPDRSRKLHFIRTGFRLATYWDVVVLNTFSWLQNLVAYEMWRVYGGLCLLSKGGIHFVVTGHILNIFGICAVNCTWWRWSTNYNQPRCNLWPWLRTCVENNLKLKVDIHTPSMKMSMPNLKLFFSLRIHRIFPNLWIHSENANN